jgi:hypothetical protein
MAKRRTKTFNSGIMSKIIRLTESQMVTLIEKVIKEQHDSKKLYSREYIVNRLKNGPKELKKYIRELPYIDCTDGQGNSHVCTTIPEVIHVFLSGRY